MAPTEKAKPVPMRTTELRLLCAGRFSAPAYGSLFEVPDGTGAGHSRTADMIAMSVWPSRGLEIIGAELKVSRGDWLKEKKAPAKADGFFRHCHRWYLITGPGVVREADEIPAVWGWLEAKGEKLVQRKEAPLLTPEPPSIQFLAGLFRKLSADSPGTHVERSELHSLADKKAEAQVQALRDRHAKDAENWTERLKEAGEERTKLKSLLVGAGVLHSWQQVDSLPFKTLQEVGAALSLLLASGPHALKSLENAETEIQKNLAAARAGMTAIAGLTSPSA